MISLLVMTSGRLDYLERTMSSAMAQLRGPISEWLMFDDSAKPEVRKKLRVLYPRFHHFDGGMRRGFGGAIDCAWKRLRQSTTRFVAHLEDDFIFPEPVDLNEMVEILEAHPYLAQLALRRQAWNAEEKAAGGFVEMHPDNYTEKTDGKHVWLEHRSFFTTNPSLYRRDLCDKGWPMGRHSEGHFGFRLKEEGLPWGVPGDAVHFGFLGGFESGRERCIHIGNERRSGCGY